MAASSSAFLLLVGVAIRTALSCRLETAPPHWAAVYKGEFQLPEFLKEQSQIQKSAEKPKPL